MPGISDLPGLPRRTAVVADRMEARQFGIDDLADATSFAMGEVTRPADEPTWSYEGPRDAGLALLEPISVEEIAGTEPILEELWRAVHHEELTEAQRAQISAMAELLKAQQMEMVPGQTARWKLVGPMRLFLRYLVKEAPRDALAWWKLVELLTKIKLVDTRRHAPWVVGPGVVPHRGAGLSRDSPLEAEGRARRRWRVDLR